MNALMYAYVVHPTKDALRSLLGAFSSSGFSFTHVGKSDPPKRFSGTQDEALQLILSGTDLTNWTFIRDSHERLHFTIQIRRDPRWSHSTFSASGPSAARLRELATFIEENLVVYAAILGSSGLGKNQEWEILSLSADCPEDLRSQIRAA